MCGENETKVNYYCELSTETKVLVCHSILFRLLTLKEGERMNEENIFENSDLPVLSTLSCIKEGHC